MIVVEIALAISTVALLGSHIKDYVQKKKIQHLRADKEKMQEVVTSLMDPDDKEPKYEHTWLPPTEDVFYKSKNPLSNDVVVARSAVCKKCQMIHRYIIRGQMVAEKNGLSVDGFFISGVRVPDRGCSIKSEKVNALSK